MFLAATSNKAFWDVDDELLFLGPWCTRYDRRHEWEGLKYQMLPNPWDDRKRLDEAIWYILHVQDHCVEELCSYLNKTHNVSYSSRYWRILLGPWLNYYTHTLYSRYVHIRAALDLFPDIRTLSLAPDCWATPRNTSESVAFSNTDRFSLQLSSQVLRALGHGTPEKSVTFPKDDRQPPSPAGLTHSLQRFAARTIRQGLPRVRPTRRVDIILCDLNFSIRHVWTLMQATGFRAWPMAETLSVEACGEKQSGPHRSDLGRLHGRDEFERVLIKTLPDNFPSLFLEGYTQARRACLAGWRKTPKVLISSAGWICNEYFKLLAAECSERGSRLIGIQYSGSYGIWKTLTTEVFQRAICDRWYAWGWSSLAADQKVKDLPSPHLSRLTHIKSRRRGTSQILYVGAGRHLFLGLLVHCPMEAQYEVYLGWQIKLIASLPEQVSRRLLVRLHPIDFGWNEALRLKDAVPHVRFDDFSQTFADRLTGARLAVFDHPGAALFECLASGVPCLMFWNPRHWEFRPSAAPYLDHLRAAGILFDDPFAASAQLVRIYEDPQAWWHSEPVRKAREAFAECFVLTRQNWGELWVKELQAEAALSHVVSDSPRVASC